MALNSLQAELNQSRKDSSARLTQIEQREKVLTEALSIKEKQFYDCEIRRSALDSKIDFLTRTNQRLREDLLRQLDHIGNLKASNRKLLDLLARNSTTEEKEVETKDFTTSARLTPKPRAVPDRQTDKGGLTNSSPPESA